MPNGKERDTTMEITRKVVSDILGKHSGFIRLDAFVTAAGMLLSPVTLWTVHDALLKKRRAPKEDAEEAPDKYIPGIVAVDSEWYNREAEAVALNADVMELFRNIDTKAGGPSVAFLDNHLVVSSKRDVDGGGTYVTLLLRNVK